jgi:hypothetical protein
MVGLGAGDRIGAIVGGVIGAGAVIARPADAPNGALDAAPLVGRFQLTIPARMPVQNASYRSREGEISEADRP